MVNIILMLSKIRLLEQYSKSIKGLSDKSFFKYEERNEQVD